MAVPAREADGNRRDRMIVRWAISRRNALLFVKIALTGHISDQRFSNQQATLRVVTRSRIHPSILCVRRG